MKRILILIGLILTLTLSGQKVPTGIIASQKATASAPANMISNGTFDSGTGWDIISQTGLSITGGVLNVATSGYTTCKQIDADMQSSISPNTTYTLTFDLAGNSQWIAIWNSAIGFIYSNETLYTVGSKTINFTTPADIGTGGFSFRLDAGTCTIDNVSLTAD